MRSKQKGLLIVLVVAMMFAAVPLVMAQDQPPEPPQPPQPPPDANVNVNVGIPWGTIIVIAVVALLLFAVVGLAGGRSETVHTVEHVDQHHHDTM